MASRVPLTPRKLAAISLALLFCATSLPLFARSASQAKRAKKGKTTAEQTFQAQQFGRRLPGVEDDEEFRPSRSTSNRPAALRATPRELRMQRSRSWDGDLRSLPQTAPVKRERPERELPDPKPRRLRPVAPEAGIAPSAPIIAGVNAPAPAPIANFAGLDFNTWGAGHPPDTNGDVGPNHYIETINTSIGIFDKSDGSLISAFTFDTFMSQGNFGNLCDTDNFGDPIVLYDTFDDRWVITDFAFQLSGGDVLPPALQCVAVSKTSDPVAGGWNFYSTETLGGLGDYPKLGVWPDGIYMSVNMFDYAATGGFQGPRVYAFNKAEMYAGSPTVKIVSFDGPSDDFTLLPSNARLQTGTPPAGTPNYFVSTAFFLDALNVYKMHVDWDNIPLSTFTGPDTPLAATAWPDANVPNAPSQGGNNLDVLQIRAMMQNQYSNLAGVESLWATHTVRRGDINGFAAPRWYQVDVTGGTVAPNLPQAATWDPDGANVIHRFMPSLAVNRIGDLALGYSTSSSTTKPAIKYAGRLAGDPVNTFSQEEQLLIQGAGTQVGNCGGSACTRWGDYSAMTLDPDGCTFWYTNMYYAVDGLNHQTRIGSFAYPGCTPVGGGGTLTGTVTDAGTSAPLAGATVMLGSRTTTTDGGGVYSFSVPAGTYPTVTAAFAGYNSSTFTDIVVTDGGTTTQDFALTTAATSGCFTDTTLADFLNGSQTDCDLTSSPGDIKLVAGTTVNQQNTTLSNSGVGITITTWGGQTFTPSVTAPLAQVDINLFCFSCTGTTPDLTLSLRATSGGLPTGADLASATVAGFSSGAAGFHTATFSSPPMLTSGTMYALVIRPTANPSAGTYALTRSSTDVYPGGTRVSGATSGTVWSIPLTAGATTDAGFKVHMDTGFGSPGMFFSSVKDANPAAGKVANWGVLNWNATTPAGTLVRFQIAATDSAIGPFNFVGPDGTAATFFSNGASLAQFDGQRYLKYEAVLTTTDSTMTPTLHDVTLCFENLLPATSLAVDPATGPYGGTADLSATLTSSSTPLSGKTVSFTLNGTPAGSGITNGSGVATVSGASLVGIAPGVYPGGVAAEFAGDSEYSGSTGSNTLTVTPPPSLSISDVSVTEGNAGSAIATLNVTLSAPSSLTVTVNYATADGSATQPSDYTSASGTLTFPPGTTTLPVMVSVNGDTVPEPDETVFVNLTAPTNATISDGQGVITILNDEGPSVQNVVWTSLVGVSATGNSLTKTAGTSAFDAGAVSTQSFFGDGYVQITASQTNTYRMFGLSNGNTNASDADIDFALYLFGDGTLRIKEGGVSRFVSGSNPTFGTYMTGDLLRVAVEGGVVKYRKNGTLLYTSTVAPTFPLLVDTSLFTPASTITNAVISFDGRPRISISDASVTEGNTGTTTATFTLTLSAAAAGPVTVDYATSDSSATSPSDYAAATGTVTFNPGETSKPVAVTVNGDSTEEPNETFFVDLSNASVNSVINDGHGIGTILNDDGPVVANVVWTSLVGTSATGNNLTKTAGTSAWDAGAVSTQSIPAGIGYVEITASETSTYRIFGLSNGNTNASDVDIDFGMYLFLGEIRIKEGGVSRMNGSTPTFGTFVTGDHLRVAVNNGVVRYSKNGTVFYTSTVPATYPLLVDTSLFTPGATINGAVISFDPRPILSINDVTVTEGNTGTTMATFTVTLSAMSPTAVTVDYATADGTATTADNDYLTATGTLTLMAGETSKPLAVTVNGGTNEEGNETFFVNLSNASSNAVIGDAQGLGTINNDDGPIITNVIWTSLVGTSATGNTLTKTAMTSAWDAGAVSTQSIPGGDGGVDFTVNETNTYRVVGLSNGNSNASESDIDFGIYVFLNEIRIKEGGINRLNGATPTFGTVVAGDHLQVGVDGGVVRYAKNNVPFYTSTVAPVFPLLIDTSLYTPGATVTNARIITDPRPLLSVNDVTVTEGNGATVPATFTVTLSAVADATVTVDYATANGTAVEPGDYTSGTGTLTFNPGETTKMVTIDVAGDLLQESTETFTLNLSNASSNAVIGDGQGVGTILDNDSPPVENVVWTSLVGTSATGNNLTKTAMTSAWDAGAVSTRALGPGDGYVDLTASQTTTYRMIGLSNGNTNATDADIDFALYLYGDGTIRIKEGGVSRFSSGSNPTFGTYMTGDHLRVSVEGGVVKYRKNGTLLYTSTLVPVSPLLVDTSLWSPGATLTSVVISGNLQ
jgi:hypothetical protein